MKIIDLDEQNAPLYFVCLEDWSDEMKEAGNLKELWYRTMKDKGLRVKLALDDNEIVGGMIHYIPIEHSFAEGKDLYFINCIWVHGYKMGRGNFRHQGMGEALLEAAEEDVKALGSKGIVAWGLLIPVFMRASWFKKHGYRTADRTGLQALVWKPFAADAAPPKWIRRTDKPLIESNKVTITAYCNGWCPAQNLAVERAKRAAADPQFSTSVAFHEVNTRDDPRYRQAGLMDALFINQKEVRTGPPPSYEKVHKMIAKAANRLAKNPA